MNVFEQKNAEFVTEFDCYVREHPDFAERIPDNALLAMLVEGDEAFNRWSQEGAKGQAGVYPLSLCLYPFKKGTAPCLLSALSLDDSTIVSSHRARQ